MILPFNAFTIHSLVGFMVTGSLATAFYVIYFRLGRKLLDLLSANYIACIAGLCLVSFMTDNLVPAGMSAMGWPNGPSAQQLAGATMHIHRLAWAFGLLAIPLQLHFVLYYCRPKHFLLRHMRVIYVLAFMAIMLVWTPLWLTPRATPLADTSNWRVTLPWIPDPGYGVILFFLGTFSVEGYSLVLLWRTQRQRGSEHAGSERDRRLVFLAFAIQTLFGLLDVAESMTGLAGVAMVPAGSTLMGLLLAAALIQGRIESDRAMRQLEREKAAILEGAQQPVAYFSNDMKVQWANAAAADYAGVPIAQLIGSQAQGTWGKTEDELRPLQRSLNTGLFCQAEITRPDGSSWVIYASPISGDAGGAIGTVGIAMNISRIRWAEETLRNVNVGLLSAREEERRSVASELHDSVAQSLAALHLGLQSGAVDFGSPARCRSILDKATERCRQVLEEVRNICHGLYPPTLDSLGVVLSLEKVLDGCRSAGIPGRVYSPKDLIGARFTRPVEIAVFRIAQEAISNAIRHGKPSRIDVLLGYDDGHLSLSVADDGVGFNADDQTAWGLGMNTMRSRMGGIGGHLEVSSEPGQTCIEARVKCDILSQQARSSETQVALSAAASPGGPTPPLDYLEPTPS